ncbi:MAG TPA: AI-2E family transporter, partial [Candidatus Anaerotruncus excrementipullorum]|nr:AI-2E family transporter [Candidatus Anaerotruncus excrementipullorum]
MTTEKKRKFIIDFVYLALILALSYLLLRYALPLLMPFALAFLIAYLLRRPIRFLSRKLRLPNSLIAVLLVVLVYGGAGLILVLFGLRIAASVGDLVGRIPTLYTSYVVPTLSAGSVWLEDLLAGIDPSVLSALEEIRNQLIRMLGQLVSSLSVWVTGWV